MKITFKKGLLAAIAALTVCSARADEGMWLLQLMKQQNSIDMMKKQGLKLEADDLYNPWQIAPIARPTRKINDSDVNIQLLPSFFIFRTKKAGDFCD